MQLVAYGAQEIYLTGSPRSPFSRLCIADTLTFLMESIQQTWNGEVLRMHGTATISRNGDLIPRCMFK